MDDILYKMRAREDALRKGRRSFLVFVAVLTVVVLVWLGGALTGVLPLGFGFRYEQWSSKPENLYGVSGWRTGPVFGAGLFYFRAGERIYVDYDATVYQGDFTVIVVQTGGGRHRPTPIRHVVAHSGKSRVEGTIPENGLYRFLHYAGLAIGSGTGDYEAEYSVAWGFVR